jgi:hypothetical protein
VYSPRERTALVLLGTGTAGAYHAGVLRALREAGVRIDVVAGCGMGAASALFAAVDAGASLWDEQGLWLGSPGPARLYPWRGRWRVLAASVGVAALLLALPLVAVAAAALAYPLVLALMFLWPEAGELAMARWADTVLWLISPAVLAGAVPRLAAASLLAGVIAASLAWAAASGRGRGRRSERGAWWWQVLGAPLDAASAARWCLGGFWRVVRGAAPIAQPDPAELGRRYAELLHENLGQPGYRELVLVAHDLDARRDLVFVLLADAWRARALGAPGGAPGRERELIDLSGAGRVHVADAVAGALAVPILAEPHRMAFAPESGWRGETHRLADRPGAVSRLFLEVARAGATQLIVVSPRSALEGPHALAGAPAAPRARLGEYVASAEVAALADAVAAWRERFATLFEIRPAHNPIGPFDFRGRFDERSDRWLGLRELVERGYEDAYRQFIEPAIGDGGDEPQVASTGAEAGAAAPSARET